MKLHEAVAQTLQDLDVQILFGLMGDANMAYMSGWEAAGGETVHAVAEGGAVGMADGYARSSGRLGVVTVTHGPGVTNSLTALTEAVRANSAVLLITGDTAAKRHERQFIDLRAAASLVGAEYRRVMSADHVVEDIAMAAARVMANRIPMILDIPHGLLVQDVDYSAPAPLNLIAQRIAADPDSLDRALGIIASANRPIILAGRGAVDSGCRETLIELADLIGAPLATTLLAREWFRDEPFDLGIFGTLSHPAASDAIAQADCVLAFGASLNQYTTYGNDLLEGKRVVQCDIEPRHVNRFTKVDSALVGDARTIAEAMVSELRAAELPASGFRSEKLRVALAERDPSAEFDDLSPAGMLDIRTVSLALDSALPADRVVVTDGGRHRSGVWPYLTVSDPTNFNQTVNFGSIGLGTAVALGAAFAKPGQVVMNVTGDAGGAMAMNEFIIAARHKLPFVFLMFNDSAYGAEYRNLPDNYGIDPKFSQLSWPEFSEVGKSFGGHGIAVTSQNDLDEAMALIEQKCFPLWIDVKVDPKIKLARTVV